MTVTRTAADVLSGHVTLEIESIDRMYLNLYVPPLQRALGVVGFFKHHRGLPFASGAVMQPITDAFVAAIHRYADQEGIEFYNFKPGQRKDEVALEYLAQFDREEGIMFIGVAQEKTWVWGAGKRRSRCGLSVVARVRPATFRSRVDGRSAWSGDSALSSSCCAA